MECKITHINAMEPSNSSVRTRGRGHNTDDVVVDTPHVDCPELQTVGKELLDTINEAPEAVKEIDDGSEKDVNCKCQTADRTNNKETVSGEKGVSRSHESNKVPSSPNTDSKSSYRSPLPSTILSDPNIDQEDASSVDEGIQTSPPFETDDPWEQSTETQGINLAEDTPTTRRFSMTAALLRSSPGRSEERSEESGATLRSPTKSWLAEEVKARRWRYRPKSCSLPHMDWLKQRTETALDRSAEMQRRTAELLQSAKAIRDLEV